MGKSTGIAWTDSTWSPWIGCTKVSPGCDHCYAEALDNRHKYGGSAHWGAGVPRYRTKSWGQPILWNKKAAACGKRWTVFPSLCDPFDNEVPDDLRVDFWKLIRATPHLTWLLLTKRIGNAVSMIPYHVAGDFDHVWIGASVVNQAEADRDIPKLLAVPAAKRFVSYEPGLGPVSFRPWLSGIGGLDWVIVGGESDQGAACARFFDFQWARNVLAECLHARVPAFIKQLGSTPFDANVGGSALALHLKDRAAADPAEWPADLRVQEFPW